jgi:hypothetical protein
MNNNHTIKLAEVPIGGHGGAVWNRLHAEREEICEALLKCSEPAQERQHELSLQARLRNIDDALDRLMSNPDRISNEDRNDQSGPEILLNNLKAFDTLVVHTHNSEYRLLLLDPKTGRALVEGGSYLLEPSEGFVKGSAFPGASFDEGAIRIGGRLEMWAHEQIFLTSPVKSVEVKHNAPAETPESISAALHEAIA